MAIDLAALAAGSFAANVLGDYFQADAAKDAARRQEAMQREVMRRQDEAYNELSPAYDPYIEQGGRAFNRLSGGILGGEFEAPVYGQFEYGKTAQDFLDPSMDYQIQQGQNALQESAAMGGQLRSGATLQALQNQAQDYAMQDYGNAYNRMTQDKNFAYQDFNNRYNAARARIQDRYSQLSNLSSIGQSAQANLQNLRLGKEATDYRALGGIADAQVQRDLAGGQFLSNTVRNLGNMGGQIAGGMMGAPQVGQTMQPMQYTQQNPVRQEMDLRAMGYNPNMPNIGGNL